MAWITAQGRYGKGVRTAWGAVLTILLFSAVPFCHGQEPPPRQPRARELLSKGIDQFRRQEYEAAADNFSRAKAAQKELVGREISDLETMIQQNNQALQFRRDAKLQLAKAQELIQQGRPAEAKNLINSVMVNQYIHPKDRQLLEDLNRQSQSTNNPMYPGKQRQSYSTLLKEARQALNQGDPDRAEMYVRLAEKEKRGILGGWPFGDTPAKIMRDIQTARQRGVSPSPKGPASPGPVKNLLRRDNPPGQPDGRTAPDEGPTLNPPAGSRGSSSNSAPKDATAKAESSSPLQTVKHLFSWPGASTDKKADGNSSRPEENSTSNKPDIPDTQAVSLPSSAPAANPVESRAKARELVKQGYQAMRNKDYETARKLAYQAKELRPDLEWWEQNPDRLLADIQRRAPAEPPSQVVQTSAKPAPDTKEEPAKSDPRALLQKGRSLLRDNKLDEAEKLCALAAGVPNTRWGLFEDSPEKLRAEIQKLRTRRDRDESVRLLTEARKLFAQGRHQEAKNLAWRAQQLHGAYSVWDVGDRPQRLLAEIERAETNPNRDNPIRNTEGKPADKNQTAKNGPGQAATPGQQGAARNTAVDPETRNRARVMVAEARELQKKGMLIEARQRALDARQIVPHFAPEEDGPENVLKDLSALCNRQVEFLLHRAGEFAGASSDPARFQKAEADLASARNLASAFGHDLSRIDHQAGWVRHLQSSAGIGSPPPLAQNGLPQDTDPNQQVGRDKLDRALLELKAGNTHVARRLAEEVYDPRYGVQAEALAMLRSVDAEEHNQAILASHRNAEAGLEAFKRRDYRQARSILASVDVRLLNPQLQNLLREVVAGPEMQQEMQVASAKEVIKGGTPLEAPGQAQVGDLPQTGQPPENLIENYSAMEDVLFQKLRLQSLDLQRKAIDLFGSGQSDQAIELLKDYLEQLGRSQLEAERLALLRKPIETRIQQYRTLQAQKVIQGEQTIVLAGTNHNEAKYQMNILKTQEEVAKLIKQYRQLMKENKPEEALACIRRAKELDPDNVAADAGEFIATVRINQKKSDNDKRQNEDYFIDALRNQNGPYVGDMNNPMAFDKNRLEQIRNRAPAGAGYSAKTRNPIERAIESRLSTPITLNFKDTPLKQAIYDLQTLSGVNVVADEAALRETSVSLDQPLSLMVENISLKSALNLLLKQVHLTYVIQNEVLNITTESRAKGNLKPVTYPVADLVVPVGDNPLPEVYSLRATLERHIASTSAASNMGMPIMPGPYSLQNGQTVSAMGSSATDAQTAMGGSSPRMNSKTIEDLLINLIQNTVAPDTWSNVGGPGTIQYFPLGMALVVNQTQDVQEQVQDLLAALRKLQDLEVAIEMRLVSVSEAFFERIGMDFDVNILTHNGQAVQNQLLTGQFQPPGVINRFTPGKFVSGLTPAGVFTPDLNIPINATSFGMSAPPFGGYPGTLNGDGGLALGLAFLSDIQVFMFMEAAQGDRRTNVMQAPKITVFNGQTAFINVQDQQFFLIGVSFVPTPFGNIIFNPQQTPFPLGVTLQVTPVVSADRRFVRMNLTPNMTNLASTSVPLIPVQLPIPTTLLGPGTGTTSGPPEAIFQMFFQQPTFTTITLSTTVNVPDGGTVLLGGLKTLSEARNEFGPPILSKIPYINRLFKNVGYGKEAQSLMIMVTPRIIINEEEELIHLGQLPPIPRF